MTDQDDAGQSKAGREISTIGFPYFGLDEAISLAKAAHSFGGGVPLDRDQIATAIDSAGGTLANKLSAARQFGLIEGNQGKWSLTPLGYDIIDPAREAAAKAEAFLRVELYKHTYDTYRGNLLPGSAGLEHAFTTFGVSQKQKQKARQIFERSARVAGFFPKGKEDRLVQPVIGAPTPEPAIPATEEVAREPEDFSAMMKRTLNIRGPQPPSFMGWLLDELPEAKTEWSIEDQANWLQAVAQAFRVVYKSGDGGVIKVSISTKSGAE